MLNMMVPLMGTATRKQQQKNIGTQITGISKSHMQYALPMGYMAPNYQILSVPPSSAELLPLVSRKQKGV